MARIKTVLVERQLMHQEATRLVAIKAGQAPMPTHGDVMMQLQKQDRLRLLERKRKFRKYRRYLLSKRAPYVRRHPLF